MGNFVSRAKFEQTLPEQLARQDAKALVVTDSAWAGKRVLARVAGGVYSKEGETPAERVAPVG